MRIEICEALRDAGRLAHAMRAEWIGQPPPWVQGIATDSGEILPGDLFVALRGERTNGLLFSAEAMQRGAVGVLAAKGTLLPQGLPLLGVEDPVAALLCAAHARRRASNAFLLAISGSTGKTTLKEVMAALLTERGCVAWSKGNFNSMLGFPLSLLSFEECDFWVAELGINHPGEMASMASAAEPDLAVLTNIGSAHIGQYRDRDQLIAEKAQLASSLRQGGHALIPADLPVDVFPCKREQLYRFGAGGDFCLEAIAMGENCVCGNLIAPDRVITNLTIGVSGRIGASLLETAASAALLTGLSEQELRRGLSKAAAVLPRMRELVKGDLLLIDDAYNASPEAMTGALDMLMRRAARRPAVAVLGDMLELGAEEEGLHRGVGEEVAACGVSLLFTFGSRALEIAKGALACGMPSEAIRCFGEDERGALVEAICRCAPRHAVILFKGSGKMKLSEVVKAVWRK